MLGLRQAQSSPLTRSGLRFGKLFCILNSALQYSAFDRLRPNGAGLATATGHETMDADYFLTVANQTMWVLALASAPILIPALLAGLILGMIQAATSINEQTLSFVPKLLVVAFSIMIFGSLILGLLSDFTVGMFERIPDLVK